MEGGGRGGREGVEGGEGGRGGRAGGGKEGGREEREGEVNINCCLMISELHNKMISYYCLQYLTQTLTSRVDIRRRSKVNQTQQ